MSRRCSPSREHPHAPSEVGVDSFRLIRATKCTALRRWLVGTPGRRLYHNGRLAKLLDLVNNYNARLNLDLSDSQLNDLIEHVKRI